MIKINPKSKEGLQVGEFPIDFVLNFVQGSPEELNLQVFIVDGTEYTVNMSSKRYYLFKENLACLAVFERIVVFWI